MSSSTSSRRQPRHLSLFHNESSRSLASKNTITCNIETSKYQQMLDNYKSFLQMFENKIQKVCQKQNYRIYLNDRKNQKTYKSLIEQKNNLLKAIQQSKDYRKSANRQLIQQVMSLQKQRQQYIQRNNDVVQNMQKKKSYINKKRLELKQLERQIKSYWIYSYDLSSTMGGNSTMNSGRKGSYGDKENYGVVTNNIYSNNNNISISITSPININTNSHPHLPCISPKSLNSSSLINQSQSQSITVFSKQLSLINSSPTREKLLQKINFSYQQQAQNKLQYEREKLSLLKMFCAYLKKMEQDEEGITDRLRLEKVANQLLEKIKLKENKLDQIESLIKK